MELHEIDLTDPIFDEGDDERCPMCGAPLGRPIGSAKEDGVISLLYGCDCGFVLTFDYWLNRVTAERE